MNPSMLTTAVFELVQHFYHATDIGNVASGDSKGGPGWVMAPPDFCLAPVWIPNFFLISRLSSFGWHIQ